MYFGGGGGFALFRGLVNGGLLFGCTGFFGGGGAFGASGVMVGLVLIFFFGFSAHKTNNNASPFRIANANNEPKWVTV